MNYTFEFSLPTITVHVHITTHSPFFMSTLAKTLSLLSVVVTSLVFPMQSWFMREGSSKTPNFWAPLPVPFKSSKLLVRMIPHTEETKDSENSADNGEITREEMSDHTREPATLMELLVTIK